MSMQLGVRVDGVEDLLLKMSRLPPSIQKKYLGAAVKKAASEELKEIRQLTPKGPTGNLRRSVGFMLDKKKRAVTVTGVLGYRRGGQDKSKLGYHAWWIEEGVKDRVPKGRAFRIPADRVGKYDYLYGKASAIGGEGGGSIFFRTVKGFLGSGRFRAWADANLPQIRQRLENVLGEYVQKAIDEQARRDFRKIAGK